MKVRKSEPSTPCCYLHLSKLEYLLVSSFLKAELANWMRCKWVPTCFDYFCVLILLCGFLLPLLLWRGVYAYACVLSVVSAHVCADAWHT